jgi:EpsI family protein
VEAELRADFNLQRAYVDGSGEVIWLYVGYYGTRHGGRPEHTPRGCYTGAGWGIRAARTLDVDPMVGFRVNEYVVEREGAQQLVHYWYRSHRRTGLLGGLDQNLDRVAGRLLSGRADGALVRISTPLPVSGDEVMARSRLLAFAAEIDSELARRWPRETRTDG